MENQEKRRVSPKKDQDTDCAWVKAYIKQLKTTERYKSLMEMKTDNKTK